MFTTLIIQPIFNLLVLIYALLPGHNFGLALIIFTVVVRLLLWPLVKRQLHQTKKMRHIQPDIKRVKKEAKGDRQKESQLLMALYKEKGINPVGSLGPLFLQLPILLGLYSGLRRIISDPHNLISFSYPWVQHLPWMKHLATNIHQFDSTLFGFVDLTKHAIGASGIYWPAMLLVLGSAYIQFLTSRQLLPNDKEARGLRQIMRDGATGKQADQSEVSAAVGRSTQYLLPVMIILFTINLPSLLGLYWLVGGVVAYIQQSIVLREDEQEMEKIADKPSRDVSAIPEAEVVAEPTSKQPKTTKKPKPTRKKKRR